MYMLIGESRGAKVECLKNSQMQIIYEVGVTVSNNINSSHYLVMGLFRQPFKFSSTTNIF